MPALSKTAPAQVSRGVMWSKLKSATGKLEKHKESALHAGEVLGLAAVAGGTAVATAMFFKKYPEYTMIPGTKKDGEPDSGIPLQPIVGGGLILLGAINKSKSSFLLVALGLGFLLPYLFDVGEEIEFAD